MQIPSSGCFALLLTIVCVANAQRTYMRTCECEYVSNGKCAYTILLPIGDAAVAATCDPASQATGSAIPDSDLASIRAQLADVQLNVTILNDWSTSQSRLLSQLQGIIIDLQSRIVSPNAATGDEETTPGSSATPSLEEIQRLIQNLGSNVEALSESQNAASRDISSLNVILTDTVKRMRAVQEEIPKLRTLVTENESTIRSLQGQLQKIKDSVCPNKGLLVSGKRASIPDDNITASSQFNDKHGPSRIRLNNTQSPGAWCPQEPNTDYEWIQFDLGSNKLLFGTVLKGRFDFEQWVTSYRVQYAFDAEPLVWNNVTDVMGDPEVFPGNHDKNTLQMNMFWTPIRARLIRIIPMAGFNNANKCMRADVIGCLDDAS